MWSLFRANLNTTYFSNRQDRYLQFIDQPNLANYCFDFLRAASTFSYTLLPSSNPLEDYSLHWSDPSTHPHRIEPKAQQAFRSLQKAQRNASTARPVQSIASAMPASPDEPDVLVFPMIQAGQFDIREEEHSLSLLFRELSAQQRFTVRSTETYDGPLIDLTSGYFSLHKLYQSAVINSELACRILAASPKVSALYHYLISPRR